MNWFIMIGICLYIFSSFNYIRVRNRILVRLIYNTDMLINNSGGHAVWKNIRCVISLIKLIIILLIISIATVISIIVVFTDIVVLIFRYLFVLLKPLLAFCFPTKISMLIFIDWNWIIVAHRFSFIRNTNYWNAFLHIIILVKNIWKIIFFLSLWYVLI